MQHFFTPDLSGETYKLNPEESKHCVKVLRMREGEPVVLADGKGTFYRATVTIADPRGCLLHIESKEHKPLEFPYGLTIAIAPTKNSDRFEWFAEKATEIGVTGIVPLLCRHSERKELKHDRTEKILISAMKQSGRSYLPVLEPLTRFDDLVRREFNGVKLIAHCVQDAKMDLCEVVQKGSDHLLLIGPEGDFSKEEIALALENGFKPVTLGEARLRTETAGVFACAAVAALTTDRRAI